MNSKITSSDIPFLSIAFLVSILFSKTALLIVGIPLLLFSPFKMTGILLIAAYFVVKYWPFIKDKLQSKEEPIEIFKDDEFVINDNDDKK